MTNGQTPTNDPRYDAARQQLASKTSGSTQQPAGTPAGTPAGSVQGAPAQNAAPQSATATAVDEKKVSTADAEADTRQPKKPTKRWPNGKNGYGASVIYGLFMVILGAIGLFMSFIITVEKIQLAEDPNFVPSCTIDNIMSCGSVMESPQASAFGFPNPLIGLMGFSIVITLGVLLTTGVRFPRWIWWGQALGLLAALVFVHWLAFNAIYEIVALCPYCMVVWAVIMPLFVMTVVHMARDKARAKGNYFGGNHFLPLLVVLVWYAAITLLIYLQFYA